MMGWKLISVIVLTALGLLGVKKLQSSFKKGRHIPSPNEDRFSSSNESHGSSYIQPKSNHDDFDLSKLEYLFETFSMDVSAYDALYHLLNAIAKKAYQEALKAINEKANTPTDLIELVNSSLPTEPFSQIPFAQGKDGPYVDREYIYKLCKDKKIPTVGSLDDLVKNLIMRNAMSGMRHFNLVFGFRIQLMKEKMDTEQDVSAEFAAIKAKFAEEI